MHVWPQNGAIYDIVTFKDDEKLYLAAGVNAMVKVYHVGQETGGEFNSPYLGLNIVSEVDSQIIVYKLKVY